MSLQWTLVAGFLYIEIALVTLFLLPWIKPRRWQKIFKSRLLKTLETHSQLYFSGLIIILLLLFSDAVRESYKYQGTTFHMDPAIAAAGAENQIRMKLFRAQRNFYISGFALFLWLVLRRLITLITYQAYLEATTESSMKQALSATQAANKLMAQQARPAKGSGDDEEDIMADETKAEIERIQEELDSTKRELVNTSKNLEVMKKQAEAVNIEYDRLMDEHAQLQDQYDRGQDDKKSD